MFGTARGRGSTTAVRGRKAAEEKPKFVVKKPETKEVVKEAKTKVETVKKEVTDKENNTGEKKEPVVKNAFGLPVSEESKKTDALIAELKKKAEAEAVKASLVLGKDLPKAFGKTTPSSTIASAVTKKVEKKDEEEDKINYASNTVDEFEKKVMKQFHPTMWVNETARRRNWFVQCKEGSDGNSHCRTFTHTITIKDVSCVGTAKKKKDAKNLAFRLMSIKLGEVLRLLKPQPGTHRPQLAEQIRSMMCGGVRGPPQPGAAPTMATQVIKATMTQSSTYSSSSQPLAVAAALGTTLPKQFGKAGSAPIVVLPSKAKPVPVQCNPGKGFVNTAPPLGAAPSPIAAPAPLPAYVPTFSAAQLAGIPGVPVTVLGDLLIRKGYSTPLYTCVHEEKGERVGNYWKWQFTMKVTTYDLNTGGARAWYGKAATKKDAKTQAAAAAFLSLCPPANIAGEHTDSSSPGMKISVLGASVPLPAPRMVTPGPLYSHQPGVAPVPVASVSAQPRPKPTREELKRTWGKSQEEVNEGQEQKPGVSKEEPPKEAPTKETEVKPGEAKKDTLDECLNEFENFLSELDEPENKKAKDDTSGGYNSSKYYDKSNRKKSKSRSRGRRSRSRSRGRRSRSRGRRSSSRSRGYEDRRRSRSRSRSRRGSGRSRSRDRRSSSRRDSYGSRRRSRSNSRRRSRGYEDRRDTDRY